jgi:hypothetical protein
MRRVIVILIAFLCPLLLLSQQKIMVHQGENVLLDTNVLMLQAVSLENHSSVFNFNDGSVQIISLSDIDSITFSGEPATDKIHITFAENQATIVNPYEEQGIAITSSGATVSVAAAAGIPDLEYLIDGTSSNGSLTMQSDLSAIFILDNLTLINPTGAAIEITSGTATAVKLTGINTLSDGIGSSKNAPLISKGILSFGGNGSLQVSGLKKHAISSNKGIYVANGNFTLTAASDGFHSEGFKAYGSCSLNITAAGDGIDAGGAPVEIGTSTIVIHSSADDVKGIKTDDVLLIDNNASITANISGAQSKGLSSKKDIIIHNGNIAITCSGAAVLAASGSGYDPSYCTAIKADNTIHVTGGTIAITSMATSAGGKGFSCDGNIVIEGGNISIATAGNGAVYTNKNGATDSYTASCIKADGNIQLLGGNINCSSSGSGGKGINANGAITIGIAGASNELLHLSVSTSGDRFYVSGNTGGGGGPGGPGGGNTDYANPKAIKAEGNLTVNSGIIRINNTQTTEGGEGLESKNALAINGGDIEIHTYDDCINAATSISITGGYAYCVSTGNDAIDANGTLTISGGFTMASGARGVECGFDNDNFTFTVSGGTIIGTGGSTSNPTMSSSTQRSIKYTGTANSAICIKKSSGEIVLLYTLPILGGNGGGPGGGGPGSGNSVVLLFSDPNLTTGSYTLQYGGAISGGTTVNGYNTGGTYSGGSAKTFTINSMFTTVQ